MTRPKSGPDQLEDILLTIAGGRSYPGSGPSSDSGCASSGEITAASGGGDTESSAAGREST